jgi:hypothetical protein
VALAAFTPGVLAALGAPALLAPAGGTTLVGGLAQLAAAYALMRCLLDPTLQWALAAGVAIFAVPIGAFLHGASTAVMAGVGWLSALLIACRIATAERCESRPRVALGGVISVALAWLVAVALAVLVTLASHLPSPEDYTRAPREDGVAAAVVEFPHPVRLPAGEGILHVKSSLSRRERDRVGGSDDWPLRYVSAAGAGAPALPTAASWPAVLPSASLLLAALRPWRRERRYTDLGWLAVLLCLGVPLWMAWSEPGGVFMAPIAALLGGGCWDRSRPMLVRRVAAAVVGLQIVALLWLWPHYPGGVRADAWLPNPDVAAGAEGP